MARFGKAIGARSARKLIREIGGAPDPRLTAEWERVVGTLSCPAEQIVRLDDGRVLWISHGSARIYASPEEYRQLLHYVEELGRRKPTHPLGTRFPRGQGFIEAVPELIGELPGKLRLSPQALTRSVDSLTDIDEAAARLGGQECLDDPTILAPIVAYVGEVMRKASFGRWQISGWEFPGADDDARWQPVVVGANGRTYPTFVILKELLESGSIRARVGYDLDDRRLQ